MMAEVSLNQSGGSDEEVNEQYVEDIYGRLVDKKTGAIVSSEHKAKQKLLELEERERFTDSEERRKLEKSLRGIINRLNESTLVSAVKTVSDLFATHSHNGECTATQSSIFVFLLCFISETMPFSFEIFIAP